MDKMFEDVGNYKRSSHKICTQQELVRKEIKGEEKPLVLEDHIRRHDYPIEL